MASMSGDFSAILADPLAPGREARREGRRVVGCLDSYVPEELVHAAGLVPVRLLGCTDDAGLAAALLPVFAGRLARSILDQGLRGDLAHLAGVALSNSSDAILMLRELWRLHLPQHWVGLVDVPAVLEGATNEQIFREAMLEFHDQLQRFAGARVDAAALRSSVGVFNEHRRLLRAAFELLAARRLSAEAYLDAVLAGFVLPKEWHSAQLRTLLARCPAEPDAALARLVPLHVSGPLLVDRSFLPLLHACGGTMVSEDLGTGSRYYWNDVAEDGDPLEAVIARYWRKVPESYKSPMEPRWRHLLDCVERSGARGVVFVIEKFSDEDQYDYPVWRDRLRDRGLPSLLLHTELAVEGEQVRTRVQTFIDMLRGGGTS